MIEKKVKKFIYLSTSKIKIMRILIIIIYLTMKYVNLKSKNLKSIAKIMI